MSKTRCSACGKKWEDHKGVQPTCNCLQVAMKTLRQIAETPRNRGARRNARATLAFLETQLVTP